MESRQLRLRLVTIEPGGVFGPVHNQIDSPGTVHMLQGTVTDTGDGVATGRGSEAGWREERNATCWRQNRGEVPAVQIPVDMIGRARVR